MSKKIHYKRDIDDERPLCGIGSIYATWTLSENENNCGNCKKLIPLHKTGLVYPKRVYPKEFTGSKKKMLAPIKKELSQSEIEDHFVRMKRLMGNK